METQNWLPLHCNKCERKQKSYFLHKTLAPGSDLRVKMVMTNSFSMPHLVQRGSNGQYSCKDKCIGGTYSEIFSHSIAVAWWMLCWFIHRYNTSGTEPNITALAISGLPSGWGQQAGVPKRKQTQKTFLLNMFTLRQATVSSSASCKSPTLGFTLAPHVVSRLQVWTAMSQTGSVGRVVLPSLQVRPS